MMVLVMMYERTKLCTQICEGKTQGIMIHLELLTILGCAFQKAVNVQCCPHVLTATVQFTYILSHPRMLRLLMQG